MMKTCLRKESQMKYLVYTGSMQEEDCKNVAIFDPKIDADALAKQLNGNVEEIIQNPNKTRVAGAMKPYLVDLQEDGTVIDCIQFHRHSISARDFKTYIVTIQPEHMRVSVPCVNATFARKIALLHHQRWLKTNAWPKEVEEKLTYMQKVKKILEAEG